MRFVAAGVLAATLMTGSTAMADTDQCASTYDGCVKDCETTYKGDTAGRAACMPQCSAKYAACDAGVAYDKAKPWLEEQAKKTKKFFDDMLKDLKKESAPETAPKDKSI